MAAGIKPYWQWRQPILAATVNPGLGMKNPLKLHDDDATIEAFRHAGGVMISVVDKRLTTQQDGSRISYGSQVRLTWHQARALARHLGGRAPPAS